MRRSCSDILTSFNWNDIADEAREAGVDTFVPKPLFAGNVMDEFQEAFRRKSETLEELIRAHA